MERGSHSEFGCLLLQVPTAGPVDFVFVTLFRTAVEEQVAKYTSYFGLFWRWLPVFTGGNAEASCSYRYPFPPVPRP